MQLIILRLYPSMTLTTGPLKVLLEWQFTESLTGYLSCSGMKIPCHGLHCASHILLISLHQHDVISVNRDQKHHVGSLSDGYVFGIGMYKWD